MDVRVNEPEEMQRFAADFLAEMQSATNAATLIALSGELGAGKTTFAQGIAKALGVSETVNSPTFVIQKIYSLQDQSWQRLIHIDAYRLKNAEELRSLGWDDLIADKNNLIIIEWPENVPDAIPEDAHRISIDIGEGQERTIKYGY